MSSKLLKIIIFSLLFFTIASQKVAYADISSSSLTSGNNWNDQNSYTTGSITPGANRLILAAIMSSKDSSPTTPTLSGNGLTWVQVGTVAFSTAASPQRRITLFRAMGSSPSSGQVTISFGGVTQTGAAWSIVEFDGVDTSGTNGSGAVVQSATNSTDSESGGLSVTLSDFGNPVGNVAYGAFGSNSWSPISNGTGFTILGNSEHGSPGTSVVTEWKTGQDTGVDAVAGNGWATAGIAAEIKMAGSSVGYTTAGGSSIGSANRVRVSRVTVPTGEGGVVSKGYMYIDGATANATVYMVAYSGSGTSSPTTLLGVSDGVSVLSTDAAAWLTFTFSTPFSITDAQDVWIGLYADVAGTTGGTGGPLIYYSTSVVGDYASDAYKYANWGDAPVASNWSSYTEVDGGVQRSWSAYLFAVPNTAPTITVNPSASYGSYTRTSSNNTPYTVSFTATDTEQTGANALTYYVHTGSERTGTQVATGTFTSGAASPTIAYNATGMANGSNTLYLSVYDGTAYSSGNPSFTVLRDDTAPTASTSISHNPSTVTTSKQYTVTFTPNDATSTNSNEMAYQIRTASGGAGTLLTSGSATSGTPKTTATITDSTLVSGANTRYIRSRDGANNWSDTSFTVTMQSTAPTITVNPSASYGGGSTRTSVNNTPYDVSFTATDAEETGANQLTYYIHTGANRTGTQVATGTFTSGAATPTVAYNATGTANGTNTFYLSAYDGTNYSAENPSFTVLRDDTAPSASTSISYSPNPVTSSKQYSVTFTPNDDVSTDLDEMRYMIRTLPDGGGENLDSGNATSGTPKTTATITDSTLVSGANTRYVRTRDGAKNWSDTSFTVTLDLSVAPTVTTNAASSVTAAEATLNGNANPNYAATTGWFRYSTESPGTCNDSFGTRVPATGGTDLGSGSSGVGYTQNLTNIAYNTTYYYCAIAQNSKGTSVGTVQSFVTLATACSAPLSGNLTISSSCAFSATVDGVDAGTGTTNTAILTIGAGKTLTIGNVSNQKIAFGQITIQSGSAIIINKGVGASLVKMPLWVQSTDADGDGYPGSVGNTYLAQNSQPGANYVRRNASSGLTLDCLDSGTCPSGQSSANCWQNLTGYTDGDGDTYGALDTPNSPSAVISQSYSGSDVAWTNPGNATTSDDSIASVDWPEAVGGAYQAEYLWATGFGFTIPTGATINGIKVDVERRESHTNSNAKDYRAYLIIGGATAGNNKADTATEWPTTDAYVSYGGSSDLWGLTPTVAQINASNFGIAFAAQTTFAQILSGGRVDNLRITVYYTPHSASICSGASLPAGYVSNGTDCDNANANIYQNLTCYGGTDTDGDGFYPTASAVCTGASCPAGYSAQQDCNNNCVSCYPGNTSTWYVADGYDNDCDGQTDEADGTGWRASAYNASCASGPGYFKQGPDNTDPYPYYMSESSAACADTLQTLTDRWDSASVSCAGDIWHLGAPGGSNKVRYSCRKWITTYR